MHCKDKLLCMKIGQCTVPYNARRYRIYASLIPGKLLFQMGPRRGNYSRGKFHEGAEIKISNHFHTRPKYEFFKTPSYIEKDALLLRIKDPISRHGKDLKTNCNGGLRTPVLFRQSIAIVQKTRFDMEHFSRKSLPVSRERKESFSENFEFACSHFETRHLYQSCIFRAVCARWRQK